ncbi:MAG: hypothetical protein ACI38A_06540 [Candidatus Ornithomonoglobus sp.]
MRQMKSEWRVTSQYIGDNEKIFQLYRLRDVNEVDHSGNREYVSGIFGSREAAAELADRLNKEA